MERRRVMRSAESKKGKRLSRVLPLLFWGVPLGVSLSFVVGNAILPALGFPRWVPVDAATGAMIMVVSMFAVPVGIALGVIKWQGD